MFADVKAEVVNLSLNKARNTKSHFDVSKHNLTTVLKTRAQSGRSLAQRRLWQANSPSVPSGDSSNNHTYIPVPSQNLKYPLHCVRGTFPSNDAKRFTSTQYSYNIATCWAQQSSLIRGTGVMLSADHLTMLSTTPSTCSLTEICMRARHREVTVRRNIQWRLCYGDFASHHVSITEFKNFTWI
jgi:hypothetical protein